MYQREKSFTPCRSIRTAKSKYIQQWATQAFHFGDPVFFSLSGKSIPIVARIDNLQDLEDRR